MDSCLFNGLLELTNEKINKRSMKKGKEQEVERDTSTIIFLKKLVYKIPVIKLAKII